MDIISDVFHIGLIVYPILIIVFFMGLTIVIKKRFGGIKADRLNKLLTVKLIQAGLVFIVPFLMCVFPVEYANPLPIEVFIVFYALFNFVFLPIGAIVTLLFRDFFLGLNIGKTDKLLIYIAASVPTFDLVIITLLKIKGRKYSGNLD